MEDNTYWKNSDIWVCTNHIPSLHIPNVLNKCWYANCESIRPYSEKEKRTIKHNRKIQKILSDSQLCGWEKCNTGPNGRKGQKAEKRKYCSHECRKKKARYTYVLKKKKLVKARLKV